MPKMTTYAIFTYTFMLTLLFFFSITFSIIFRHFICLLIFFWFYSILVDQILLKWTPQLNFPPSKVLEEALSPQNNLHSVNTVCVCMFQLLFIILANALDSHIQIIMFSSFCSSLYISHQTTINITFSYNTHKSPLQKYRSNKKWTQISH